MSEDEELIYSQRSAPFLPKPVGQLTPSEAESELDIEFEARIWEEGGLGEMAANNDQVRGLGPYVRPSAERLVELLSIRRNRSALRRIVGARVDAVVDETFEANKYDVRLACIVRAVLNLQEELRDEARESDGKEQGTKDVMAVILSRMTFFALAMSIATATRLVFPAQPALPDEIVDHIRSGVPTMGMAVPVDATPPALSGEEASSAEPEGAGSPQSDMDPSSSPVEGSDIAPMSKDTMPSNDPPTAPIDATSPGNAGNGGLTTSAETKGGAATALRDEQIAATFQLWVFFFIFSTVLALVLAAENLFAQRSRYYSNHARSAEDAVKSLDEILSRVAQIRSKGPKQPPDLSGTHSPAKN